MKKYFQLVLLAGMLMGSFAACTGNADGDGHMSLEGAADPANDGGKLGGDHVPDSIPAHNDSTHVR